MSRNKNAQQVCQPFDAQLNTAIQEIYHFSYTNSHTKFKHNVLNVIRKTTSCDSAYWATVVDVSDPAISSLSSLSFDSSSNSNSTNASVLTPEDQVSEIELLLSSLQDWKLGQSFLPKKDGHNQHNHQGNVTDIQCFSYPSQHLLVTIEKSQQSQLHDVFVLQRSENQATFSDDECMTNQFLVPHILEAYRINLLHNRLINNFSTNTAICDMKGNLLLADEFFTNALSKLHANSNGNTIPRNVFKSLLENDSLIYSRNKVIVKSNVIDDLMYIEFLEERRCGSLSNNERLVTKFMIQGLNHIDMAKQLKLPVSSILYIVNCVFKKLGIKNKAELNMKFSRAQPNIKMAILER